LLDPAAGYPAAVSDSTPLSDYLNDHLAGSEVALELLDKMCSRDGGSGFGEFLKELRSEIKADRATLEQVMETLGVAPGRIRQAGGRLLEKVSRIKFDERVTGSDHLTRLMETEALSLGIEGKLAGWRSLKELPGDGLDVDLDAMIQRAADQRTRLEPFRIAAARRSLA
jgi:hypothetical protein